MTFASSLRGKTVMYKNCRYLTIIGRGWAKYRDLSVASRSIICRSRRLRQIIDLRDTDKSRYFATTEFNNCFIIRSPSLFFQWIILGSEAISRAISRRRKARFPLRMSRIFAAKRCWTALRMSRPLFVGSYLQVTWWALGQWKERKICFE